VLRFVESSGKSEVVKLTPPAGFRQVQVCTLMEDEGIPLKAKKGVFSIPMGPWKIVTVRVMK